MGVPHTIVFVEELSKEDVYKYGPLLEKNKIFPKNTNVNFVKIEDEENVKKALKEIIKKILTYSIPFIIISLIYNLYIL